VRVEAAEPEQGCPSDDGQSLAMGVSRITVYNYLNALHR